MINSIIISTLLLAATQVSLAQKSPISNEHLDVIPCKPTNCLEIKLNGRDQRSGVYTIYPRQWFNAEPLKVYCDMETDGGGWIVIQRRGQFPSQENFDRNWTDYRYGFGDLEKEFWLGLENIYLLAIQDQLSLRIDLECVNGRRTHGIYKHFQLGDRDVKYAIYPSNLRGTADFVGLAGDPLWVGTQFTTKDDPSVKHECLRYFSGGWWLNNNCPPGEKMNNLNGVYNPHDPASMFWLTWRVDLKWAEMKIRPSHFPRCANGGSHYYYS